MDPTAALSQTLRISPASGKIIVVGLGALAAATIAISWGSDIDDLKIGAAYVLAFGFVVTILTAIAGSNLMSRVICWVVVGAFAAWVLGLVGSVLNVPQSLPPTACYLRLHMELPDVCEARLRDSANDLQIGALAPDARPAPAAPATALLWRVQETDTPIPPGPTDHDGRVFIHFTDALPRPEVVLLAGRLTGLDWNIQGADQGGEAVDQGPDVNEVRYFKPEDRDAAIDLARTPHALYPARPVYVRDHTRLGSYVRPGTLELWLTVPPGDAIQS